MKKLLSIALLLIAISASAASKQNSDTTAVFTVQPQMSCQNCENKIKSNMRFEKGVKEIETSLEKQTVSVTYNTKKTNIEALVKGFAKIGYRATIADKNNQKPASEFNKSDEGCCSKSNKQ